MTMAETDKLESGGITFDTAALDALLDDIPPEENAADDQPDSVDSLDSDTAGQDSRDGDSASTDEFDDEAPQAEIQDDDGQDIADESTDEDTLEVDESAATDTDELDADFISEGDEGPMLLTNIDAEGKPVYETADELFGDHKFKIKAAGAEHEVTFEEMRKGYQRHADYTQAKTKFSETHRALQPYIALATLWEQDTDFRESVNNYVEGVKSDQVSDDELIKATDSGDTEKVKKLLDKRNKQSQQRKAMGAAEMATAQQRRNFATQQFEIAKSLIPSYNDVVPQVKTFLTNLGYGEQEVQGFESLDARLQNLAYLAYKQVNPESASASSKTPDKKALQAKRKRIVRRPPKTVRSGPGKANTPKARSSRRAKSAFQKAYKTGANADMVAAIAEVLPDDLLDD